MEFESELRIAVQEYPVQLDFNSNKTYCRITSASSGFTLHHDIWITKRPIVLSKIKSLCGESRRIYARNTIARKINQGDLNKFLVTNHILGATRAKFKYGLYHHNELVAVASFGAGLQVDRNGTSQTSFELIRFCSLLNTTIVGGLSKLLKYFIHENRPDDIITYIDKEWGNGDSFLALGFKVLSETPPLTFCIDRETNQRYRYNNLTKPTNSQNLATVRNQGNLKLILQLT